MTGIGENTLAQPVKPPLRERRACLAKLVKNRLTLTSPGRTCSAVLEEEEDPESLWPKYRKKFEPWSEELRGYMTEHLKVDWLH